MEECLVPAHRNQHFQWLGTTTGMPKMRKVELRMLVIFTTIGYDDEAEVWITESSSLPGLSSRRPRGPADIGPGGLKRTLA